MQLIGIIGAKQSGKSVAGAVLEKEYGFTRLRFADGLKKALRAIGLTAAQLDGDDKELPLPLLCGHTPRFAMTSLGTGWGRNVIGENLWVNVTIQDVVRRRAENPNALLVIDDVRHPNEAAAIRQMGGTLIRVRRPGYGVLPRWWQFWKKRPHESERHWPTLPADFELSNDRDLPHLHEQVRAVAESLNLKPVPRRPRKYSYAAA